MASHRHWSAPAHADEAPSPIEVATTPAAAAAPALTHVFIGRYEYDGDSTTKAFATREACVAWKDGLCGDYDNFEIYHREIRY